MAWNEQVWNMVSSIPKGNVASYGQVAGLLGRPRRARQVGFALHKTPDDLILPWHRVINAKGEISFPQHSEHYLLQRAILESEGVEFDENGKIDMKVYGWRPRPAQISDRD